MSYLQRVFGWGDGVAAPSHPGAPAPAKAPSGGRLCGGAQLMHLTTPRGQKQTMWTAKAKCDWNGGKDSVVVTGVSRGQLVVGYHRRVDEKVGLATDFTYNHNSKESQVQVGYDFMLRQSRVQGKINNLWQITATLTEMISPGFTLLFSAQIDHSKGQMLFGTGIRMGQ